MVLYGISLSVFSSMMQVMLGFVVSVDFSAFLTTARALLFLASSRYRMLIDRRVRCHGVDIWLSGRNFSPCCSFRSSITLCKMLVSSRSGT